MSLIHVPVSYGELLDKITILEIKAARIDDADKLRNVRHELDLLGRTWTEKVGERDIGDARQRLKAVNEKLWVIEDDIRAKEAAKTFDEEFIELARSVYYTNDERARIKKEVNLALGSELVEEKSYAGYE